ncbi:MAG: hypothetical protein JST51_01560 [Armatimonadetes bacterium]|nr:hypothetical protein [Armatimonadota bacterium]
MSWEARKAVDDLTVGSATRKSVLSQMAHFANSDGGQIRPSVATIAARTELTPRAVQLSIKKLVDDRFLEIEEARPGHTVVYKIPSSIMAATPERGSPPNVVHPRTSFTLPPNVTTSTPERGSPEYIEYPKNKEEEGCAREASLEVMDGTAKARPGNPPLLDVVTPSIAEKVFDVLIEIPACARCYDHPNATRREADLALGVNRVAEFLSEHPDVTDAEWLSIARAVRDLVSGFASMKENSTYSEGASSMLRKRFVEIRRSLGASGTPTRQISRDAAEVRDRHGELYAAVEAMVRRWHNSGIKSAYPSGDRFAEYTKTLARCGITAAHVADWEEIVTKDAQSAPPAYSLVQLILAKVNVKTSSPIVLDDVAQDDMEQENLEKYGTKHPSIEQVRDRMRKQLGDWNEDTGT